MIFSSVLDRRTSPMRRTLEGQRSDLDLEESRNLEDSLILEEKEKGLSPKCSRASMIGLMKNAKEIKVENGSEP